MLKNINLRPGICGNCGVKTEGSNLGTLCGRCSDIHLFNLENVQLVYKLLPKNSPLEEQLIDYDVCSNWGNWAYLAGVGNDPRGNRAFNTEKQAEQYDHSETYRNHWLTGR